MMDDDGIYMNVGHGMFKCNIIKVIIILESWFSAYVNFSISRPPYKQALTFITHITPAAFKNQKVIWKPK